MGGGALGCSAAARGSLNLSRGSVDGTARKDHSGVCVVPTGIRWPGRGEPYCHRDLGERPDTSSGNAGRAQSAPILDPEPKGDRTQSLGKKPDQNPIFFFSFFFFFPSPPPLLLRKCSRFLAKRVKSESGRRTSAPRRLRALPSAEPGPRLAENPRARLAARARRSWVGARPWEGAPAPWAPAGGAKPCAGQLPGSPA